MTTARVWRDTLICVGLIAACAGAIIGVSAWINRPPAVNQAQAQAVQPALDAYMHDHGVQMGIGYVMDTRLRPQLFCAANILEIRTDGPRRHVGMVLNCAD